MISVLIGLFHKAILHSGISTCSWAVNETTPEANSFRLASMLGNDSKDPGAVAKFLRSLPVEKIVLAQYTVLSDEVNYIFLFNFVYTYQFIVILHLKRKFI